MKFTMAHQNFNVLDLEKSIKFYEEALLLKEVSRMEKEAFTIVYLGNENSNFRLELTYLKDRTEAYDLGDEEFHLAFDVDDFDAAYKKHKEMGCICFENKEIGIYFINDPDGYWIEILPIR